MTSRRRRWTRVQPTPNRRPAPRTGREPRQVIRVADLPPGSWDVVLPNRGGTHLPVTGHCHDCGVKVSSERRFCGPCYVEHEARRYG